MKRPIDLLCVSNQFPTFFVFGAFFLNTSYFMAKIIFARAKIKKKFTFGQLFSGSFKGW